MAASGLPTYRLHTINEILSQPETWREALSGLSANSPNGSFLARAASRKEWLFVGCGTSFYLAEAAAAIWTLVSGQRARAIPASEVLLFPQLAQLDAADLQVVIISRSGRTSEAVRAAEAFAQRRTPTLALTCDPASELARRCEFVIAVPTADEQSMVMTRSFSAMLLVVIQLAAAYAGTNSYAPALEKIIASLAARISSYNERMASFVNAHLFADYIYLGQGPFYPIAREACLKITEMSGSYAQAYHTLEFRHGPKSVVGPQTCLTFFLSETGMSAESEVLVEMKALDAAIIAVCNRATEAVRDSSDLVLEIGADVPEAALLAPAIVPAQLLGFHTAVQKGLNPDEPKNLSRVVILD